jgi:hypothetical protein
MHPGFARVVSVIINSKLPSSISHLPPPSVNHGTQQAGTFLPRKLSNTYSRQFHLASMSEKQPLIPIAASGGNIPRAQSKCQGRSIGKLLAATAAAALIYYGMPYSMFTILPWCLE